jgi:hypothetical protein
VTLTLTLKELAVEMIKCTTYKIEHRLNYLAIELVFDIELPIQAVEQKLLFRNAP